MNDEMVELVKKAIMAAIDDDVLPSSYELAARAAIAAIEAAGYRIVKDGGPQMLEFKDGPIRYEKITEATMLFSRDHDKDR